MERTNFEKLRVYRLAEQLSDSIWKIVRRWDAFARTTVGSQLVRSADSVGANIAEGSGRFSPNDNRRFVRMARGSLYETLHWLRRAYVRGLLRPDEVADLRTMIDNVTPMLNAYLRSIGNDTSQRRPASDVS